MAGRPRVASSAKRTTGGETRPGEASNPGPAVSKARVAIFRNTSYSYGFVPIVIHWAVAVAVVGLFALGWWMVELDYYSKWYKTAPDVHKSVGVLLFCVMVLRAAIRGFSGAPTPVPGTRAWERRAAHGVHLGLYALIFAACVAGYLISTADGRPIPVFGWFEVPATVTAIPNQEDVMGDVHLVIAIAILAIAALHALAALKHHIVDRDATLARMVGRMAAAPRSGPTVSEHRT